MAKIPKYTLTHNEKKSSWDLTKDDTNKVVKRYPTKDVATKGGELRKAVGKNGGSVKIQKVNGKFEEERTYPSNLDPESSEG